MTKLKKFLCKYQSVLVCAGTVLVLAGIASAGGYGFQTLNNTGNIYIGVAEGEGMLGTISMDKSTFDHGIEILAEGLDVTGAVDLNTTLNVDGASTFNSSMTLGDAGADVITSTGQFTSNSTTTLPKNTYSTIDITVTQTASTTAANPSPAGYWCNPGAPLVVENNYFLDLQTANTGWGANWTVGTTTLIGGGTTWTSGTNSFTNTSTDTLFTSTAITTSTTGFYDRDTRTQLGTWYDDGGNATTSPWVLGNGVCIVITSDNSGATSTDESFTTGGGESGYTPLVATFHADSMIR